MESFRPQSNEAPAGKRPKSDRAAHLEWTRDVEKQELVSEVMSGFKLGSMNEDVVKNILKEEERVLAAAGEDTEAIRTALKNKLRQLGAK
mgnify:FL=1